MEGVGGADRPVSATGAWPRRAGQPRPYDAEPPHSRQPSAAGLQPATRVRSAGGTAVLRLRRSRGAWTTRSSRIRIVTLVTTIGCGGSRVRGGSQEAVSCARESGPGISPRGWCSSPCFSVQPSPLPSRGPLVRGSTPPGRAPRHRSTSAGSSWSTSGESSTKRRAESSRPGWRCAKAGPARAAWSWPGRRGAARTQRPGSIAMMLVPSSTSRLHCRR